jgi:hypothetical protein
VVCVDCHFEPGFKGMMRGKFEASTQAVKWLTGTEGSKPHAQVSDASCLRSGCHEHRLLEGKIAWKVPSARGGNVVIHFDHTPHLTQERRGKQLRCTSCHSQMVQGQHMSVTLDACFLCHFKGFEHGREDKSLGGCAACHEAPRQEIRLVTGEFTHGKYVDRGVACENCHSDTIRGEGEVPKQVCWTCHNLPEEVERYADPPFLHQMHVTDHKIECTNCHMQIEHSLAAGASWGRGSPDLAHTTGKSGTCAQCHQKMHAGPAELYRGTGGRGVIDMPSPMFRAQVDCIACHRNDTTAAVGPAEMSAHTFVASQVSCDYCHDTQYQSSLDEWRGLVTENLSRADAAYAAAQEMAVDAVLSGEEHQRVRELLEDAEHNIRLVKMGHGVHNVNYATAVLSVAVERCQEAQDLMTKKAIAAEAGP